jgi:hypothetical protein
MSAKRRLMSSANSELRSMVVRLSSGAARLRARLEQTQIAFDSSREALRDVEWRWPGRDEAYDHDE